MPIKIGFYLQKNIKELESAVKNIDIARINIGAKYGELNSAGTEFSIPADYIDEANQELNELLHLQQDVDIHIFKLDDFNDIKLSYQQISAIAFMIEED